MCVGQMVATYSLPVLCCAESGIRSQNCLAKLSTHISNATCVEADCLYACLQLYQLQKALKKAGIKTFGGERGADELNLERAPSDRYAYRSGISC